MVKVGDGMILDWKNSLDMVDLQWPTLSSFFDDEPADRCSEYRCVEML